MSGTVAAVEHAAQAAERAPGEVRSDTLVDVVIPTHGGCPHLGKAIASVVAQTHPAWRLTLVDNSPELPAGRDALALHRHDPRVRYLATGGLSQVDNWNTAFSSGDAPYLAMLHDDDTWDPTFLERRVAALDESDECAFVFSGYREIDAEDRQTAVRPARMAGGLHHPHAFVPVEFADNIIPVSAVLYRRAAIDAVGGAFDPRVAFFDYELWLRLGSRFPVHCLDVVDNGGRVHADSVTNALATADSRRTGHMWREFLDVVEPGLDRDVPGAVPVGLRRRRRSGALLTCALDDLQGGRRRTAARHLRDALRVHPRSLADPRVPVVVLVLLAGRRVLPWVATARHLQHGHQIPAHLSDVRARAQDRWQSRRPSRTAG